MSTGTKTTGSMNPVYGTTCGTIPIGSQNTRSWNGGDGRNRENAYNATITNVSKTIFEWGDDKPGQTSFPYKGTMDSCWGAIPLTSLYSDTLGTTRSLKGVLGKYRNHDFSGAVFLGELPESVKMITGNLGAVLFAYRDVKRGKFGKAVKRLKDANGGRSFRVDKNASSNWLSLRYGWIPLCSDAYAAADAYRKISSGRMTQTRIRSKNKQKAGAPSGAYSCAVQDTILLNQTILVTDITMPAWDSLGFGNPASLAWELLPGSFILDWVYDVGSYLDLQFSLPEGIGYKYIQTKMQVQKIRAPIKHAGHRIRYSEGNGRTNISIVRTVNAAPIVPPPRLKNPFNGSMARVGDMIALAISFTK